MSVQPTSRIALALLLGAPACALAQQELALSTSVDLNYKRMTLEQSNGLASVVYKPDLWTLNVSPSLAYRGFFLSIGLERSLGDASTHTRQQATAVLPDFFIDARVQRSENTITLGYGVTPSISVFAGWLRNTTEMWSTGTSLSAAYVVTGASTYTENGPYLGVGYAHRFDNRGTLSTSLAYTFAKGHADAQAIATAGGASLYSESSADGDVRGTSLGASWSAPLTGSLYYRLGVKVTRYRFTFQTSGYDTTAKQNYNAFIIGVANYF
jgi:hypothetical protein